MWPVDVDFLSVSLFGSGSERKIASDPAPSRPLRAGQRWPSERPLLFVRIHLSSAARGALPDLTVREPVHAAREHHGHREHLRARGPTALQRRGVGQKHSVLPGPADNGPGVSVKTDLERAVRAERGAVRHAPPRGPASGGGGSACLTHVRGPSRGLHGPHPLLPGAGGEAKGPSCGRGRVQLCQSHRTLHLR